MLCVFVVFCTVCKGRDNHSYILIEKEFTYHGLYQSKLQKKRKRGGKNYSLIFVGLYIKNCSTCYIQFKKIIMYVSHNELCKNITKTLDKVTVVTNYQFFMYFIMVAQQFNVRIPILSQKVVNIMNIEMIAHTCVTCITEMCCQVKFKFSDIFFGYIYVMGGSLRNTFLFGVISSFFLCLQSIV